jgi:hypothetical protein
MMRKMILRAFASGGLGFVVGCSNQPGALVMEVTPGKETFGCDEPLVVDVTIKPVDRTACLRRDRSFAYRAELIPTKPAGESLESGQYGVCGMTGLLVVPFYPFVYVGELLDVGDGAGRFDIITPERPLAQRVFLGRHKDRVYVVSLKHPQSMGGGPTTHWTEGEYTIRLRLENMRNTYRPAPLFWQEYSHPLQAETTVRIVTTPLIPADAAAAK